MDGHPALTDSHAHLPEVATAQAEAWTELCAAFDRAWALPGDGAAPGGSPAPEGRPPEARPILVDIGTEAGDFPGRRALLGDRPWLRYSLGLWPGEDALRDVPSSLDALRRDLALAGPLAAAVGECGLDYHHMEAPRPVQLALFEGQLALARGLGLPVIVHSREAFEDTRAALAVLPPGHPVIIHCFGYGPAEARAFLDDGCLLSFAGNVTYRKAEALREALALVPSARFLLETDSPYMNPEPRRGRPCSPLDIGRTYAFAAGLRGTTAEALAETVSANARRIFG